MKIAIGSDHAGYEVKEDVKGRLKALGHDVTDFGTNSTERTDYPDYAHAVGKAVASGQSERGVLVCATGIGVCIAANKVRGIRAALAYSEDTARLSRAHNDSNVLCLGARTMDEGLVMRMLEIWLVTPFDGGRHKPRVDRLEETG
jgi:RpiB/LacA/LacB family sugar-phosphate isomerase